MISPNADRAIPPDADTATVPPAFGRDMVLSAVGSTIVRVVSNSSDVAPSNTTAFAASIVTVFTCVVVPATFKLGTRRVPVEGLYLNAFVSSRSALDSSWNTTGKLVLAVLSDTVTVLARVEVAAFPLVF